jgi:hypothetical protein
MATPVGGKVWMTLVSVVTTTVRKTTDVTVAPGTVWVSSAPETLEIWVARTVRVTGVAIQLHALERRLGAKVWSCAGRSSRFLTGAAAVTVTYKVLVGLGSCTKLDLVMTSRVVTSAVDTWV